NTNAAMTAYTAGSAEGTAWTPAINEVAWWSGNRYDAPYVDAVRPVGLRRTNQAGLYDMHGNVQEWCLDRYANLTYVPVDDGNQPMNVDSSNNRSARGGYLANTASNLRSAARTGNIVSLRGSHIGFRLCARGAAVPEP
ncbi:MAG: SUMF1/EgtB/PvdO family nonheme iron enzyme, partial [Kiritimatiellaeota bacterium]|nr:SUMF1/EgtB/PvdO family nonheme iron enzyme [Kiritimatiellota bacterium]